MEEGKCFIGLEIGSSKVASVVGLQENNKIKILGFSERKVSPSHDILKFGEVENGATTSKFINDVLDDIIADFEKKDILFDLDSVNINITNLNIKSQHKNTRVVSSAGVNKIRQEDVNRLVDDANNAFKALPGSVTIHSLPKEFYVNDEKTTGALAGKFGNQLNGDFTFITTKTEALHNLVECVNQLPAKGAAKGNLKVDNVYLNAIADTSSLLNNSSEEPESKRDGVAIVNIGADFTQISVYHNNTLRYQSIIPIAGNTINQDLMTAFGINFQEAETLKKVCGGIPPLVFDESPIVVIDKKYGLAPTEIFLKNAITIVEWRLREIAVIVKAELKKSGLESSLLNGVILTGGTSNFISIKQIFSQIARHLNIRSIVHNSAIDFNGFDKLKNPSYSTLLGLVTAPAFNFDNRIDNRILTPKSIPSISSPHPVQEKPIRQETPPAVEPLENKVGTFIKNLFGRSGSNDLNDDYNP